MTAASPPRPNTTAAVEAIYTRLDGPGTVTFHTEVLDPADLGADDVLCRTRVTGVSPGTELSAYHGHPPLRPTKQVYPRVLGYLNVADVVACGQAVTAVRPGERVLTFTSHRSHFVIAEARIRATVPEGMPDSHAAVAYLYRLALNGLRRARADAGKPTVVIGLGPIGLAAVDLAVARGNPVAALSNAAASRQAALDLGATAARPKAGYGRQLATDDLGCLPQAAVSTSNAWDDLQVAVSILGFNGVVALLGFPGRNTGAPDFNPFDPQFFYDQQLSIVSAGMAPEDPGSGSEPPEILHNDLSEILAAFADGTLSPETLVAATFDYSDLEDAYAYLGTSDHSPGTVLLQWV